MKTRKLETEYTFAGIDFPRYLVRVYGPKKYAKQLASPCGEYQLNPGIAPREHYSFYLESDFMLSLRWQWCDEIARSVRHTGWYTDEHGDSDKIRGIVFRLPRSRGFLAGWSMGEGMASEIDRTVYDDELSAALAADDYARYAAERQREYEESESEA